MSGKNMNTKQTYVRQTSLQWRLNSLDYSESYPEWATLANLTCVIHVSSVPVGRGFSLQNRIKTALRSRLQEKVNRLMRISSWRKTLDTFDFKSAAERFCAMKKK